MSVTNFLSIDKLESGTHDIGGNSLIYNTAKLATGKYIYKISIDYGSQKVSYNGVFIKQ